MGIIGAVLGDISGSKYEGWMRNELPKRDSDIPLYEPSDTMYKHLHFTDDTVLSIAVMDACVENLDRPFGRFSISAKDFEKQFLKYTKEYPAAGYGGGYYCWFLDNKRKPYRSFGNGSAMRVSFIGQLYAGTEKGRKMTERLARLSAMPTHNHPEGIKGAVTEAVSVWMAENGASKDDILQYGIEMYPADDYRYSCEKSLSSYIDDLHFCITCQDALPFAIRCFYETDSFEELLRLVRSVPCDTDTIGAIAGAIAESFYKETSACILSDRRIQNPA